LAAIGLVSACQAPPLVRGAGGSEGTTHDDGESSFGRVDGSSSGTIGHGGSEATTLEPVTESAGTSGSGDATGSSEASGPSGPPSTTDDSVSDTFDTGIIADVGVPGCAPPSLQYVWVSNATESTLSKIDTATMTEVARYATREDLGGDPAGVAVNLNGDVAVANRLGGVTVVRVDPASCPDPDGSSSGPDDVLPFPDGCVAYEVPMQWTEQAVVAWTTGVRDEQSCRFEQTKLWTAGIDGFTLVPTVALIDGDGGTIEATVELPDLPAAVLPGLFAGAVDAEGDLWAAQVGTGYLVQVQLDDLSYQMWPMPNVGWGLTVDGQGRVWTCNEFASRFDPATETWESHAVSDYSGAGCVVDADGILWMAGLELRGIDTETFDVVAQFAVPGGPGHENRGAAVDGAGYVWTTSHWDDAVHRWDPATGAVETVGGLAFPYSYTADMTGTTLLPLAALGGP
jgi:streptogramin lyase